MKRPERVSNLWRWRLIQWAIFLAGVLPIAGAGLMEVDSGPSAPIGNNFAELGAKIPLAPFWNGVLPTGKIWDFPIRWVVLVIAALIFALAIAKAKEHKKMLVKEDEARALRDI